jgi:hypothetical protein
MYNKIHEQPEVLATILEEEWGRVLRFGIDPGYHTLCGVAFIETRF